MWIKCFEKPEKMSDHLNNFFLHGFYFAGRRASHQVVQDS